MREKSAHWMPLDAAKLNMQGAERRSTGKFKKRKC